MNRHKFLRGEPRPTGVFCPKCGERITWVTKDKCPCQLKLGWEVHESVGEPVIDTNVFEGFVLGEPEYVGRMPTRQDLPYGAANDQGLTPDNISRGPLQVVSNPRVRWSEANFRRFDIIGEHQRREQEQVHRLNSQAASQMMRWDTQYYGVGPSGSILNTDEPT